MANNDLLKLIYGDTPKQPVKIDTDLIKEFGEFEGIDFLMTYIVDFRGQNICHIASRNFFIHDYTHKNIIDSGYDFLLKIICPKDLERWAKMQKVIFEYLQRKDIQQNTVDYFSFTCRMKPDISSSCIMTFNKLYPKWINEQLCFGFCTITNSMTESTGNLTLHFKNSIMEETYSEKSGKWKTTKALQLTERQQMHLTLAKQGKTLAEIANIQNVSKRTVEHDRELIFEQIEEKEHQKIKNIKEVIIYADNHNLLNNPAKKDKNRKQPVKKQKPCSHFTQDILKNIQTKLDNAQSARSIAKDVGFSETAIREAIKHGKLIKKQNKKKQ